MEEIKNVEMTEEEVDQVAGGWAPSTDAATLHRLKEQSKHPVF